MRGAVCWEKNITCHNGIVNVHITEQELHRVKGVDGDFHFRIPHRMGIDFYNFRGEGSRDWIPNVGLSDMVQIIDRLSLLGNEIVRKAFLKGVFTHKFGIELDFRRKLDLNLTVSNEDEEIIELYYEDLKRNIKRSMFGSIEVASLPLILRTMKECIVEYMHLILKSLIT